VPVRVVVIGAGFAGTAVAVALLRRPEELSIALVERSGSFGRGIAYATPDPQHLLNVPAGSMSALADEPEDLLAWAARRGLDTEPGDYLPRAVYGEYLVDALAAADGGRLRRVTGEAVRIEGGDVVLAGGERVPGDVVVLAVGLGAPPVLPALAAIEAHPGYVGDPWDFGTVTALESAERVVVVGTGLTMIDVALTLSSNAGPEIVAISTHGELPRVHATESVETGEPAARPGEFATADALAAHVEERARAAADWRLVIDSLRPVTQELWRRLPLAEKEAFYARHQRRWEVHRSRIAPQIGARLRALQDAGRLRVAAATVASARPAGDRIALRIGDEDVLADGVVNAIGPAWDCRLGDNALLRHLLATGAAVPGPVGLGLATTADGTLIGRDGRPSEHVVTLGSLRRGELWETIAVPELRTQAAELAERLASYATRT
jgi:uncharacterized NAD(P)/FAD-binding protein YdhS